MDGGQTTTNTAPAGNSSDFVSVDLFDNDIDDIYFSLLFLYYCYSITSFVLNKKLHYPVTITDRMLRCGNFTSEFELPLFVSPPPSSPVDPTHCDYTPSCSRCPRLGLGRLLPFSIWSLTFLSQNAGGSVLRGDCAVG